MFPSVRVRIVGKFFSLVIFFGVLFAPFFFQKKKRPARGVSNLLKSFLSELEGGNYNCAELVVVFFAVVVSPENSRFDADVVCDSKVVPKFQCAVVLVYGIGAFRISDVAAD